MCVCVCVCVCACVLEREGGGGREGEKNHNLGAPQCVSVPLFYWLLLTESNCSNHIKHFITEKHLLSAGIVCLVHSTDTTRIRACARVFTCE